MAGVSLLHDTTEMTQQSDTIHIQMTKLWLMMLQVQMSELSFLYDTTQMIG